MVIQVYSIRDLERTTGVARTTIHYYLRQGLLPRPQKTAASRSLYTQEHVDIVGKIAKLKREGHSLAEIEKELRSSLDRSSKTAVDLGAQEHERTHDRILVVATGEFVNKGYKNTHVTTLMRRLGITATLFYSHFPSKRRLLAECVEFLDRSSSESSVTGHGTAEDAAEHLLRTLSERARVLELSAAASAVLQVEGDVDEGDLRKSVEQVTTPIMREIGVELDREREKHPKQPVFPSEPIALALFGAYDYAALKSPFHSRCSREELLTAYLWLFLAAQAARNGEIDIDSRLARYKGLISKLSSELPPLPPELELTPSPGGA